MGRSKCVRTTSTTTTPKKVMSYSEFNQRIRKTFYYGSSNLCDIEEDMEVSRPLAEYASEFFSEPHKGHSLNRLNAIAASSVHATPCSLIMALIYLDRLNVTDPCYARRITPQELFIVSMMISTKFYAGHDEEIFISDWAEDGNMTEERLKELELEFLNAIEWNIYISNEQFFKKLNAIEKTIARREGIRRGWLTYTELTQLLPTFTLAKFLFNNFAVLAMSYAASVMTLAGAFFLASQIPSPTSLNVTKPQAAGQNDVLQATTNATSGVLMGATDHHLRPTILPVVTTKSTTKANRCNASQLDDEDEHTINALATKCFALNIEAELLKLERQYLEEARLAELRKRQHEITTDSRLKLPGGAHLAQLNDNHDRSRLSKNDQQTNWRALQEEFSNEMASGGGGKQQNSNEQQQQYLTTSTTPTKGDLSDLAMAKRDYDYTCFTEWHNCSSYELWNILSDAAQRSIVRLPLLWFKFM